MIEENTNSPNAPVREEATKKGGRMNKTKKYYVEFTNGKYRMDARIIMDEDGEEIQWFHPHTRQICQDISQALYGWRCIPEREHKEFMEFIQKLRDILCDVAYYEEVMGMVRDGFYEINIREFER